MKTQEHCATYIFHLHPIMYMWSSMHIRNKKKMIQTKKKGNFESKGKYIHFVWCANKENCGNPYKQRKRFYSIPICIMSTTVKKKKKKLYGLLICFKVDIVV